MNKSEFLPEEFRNDVQIIRETAEQIIKDFQDDELKIVFSGNDALAFDELKAQIVPFIHDIMKRSAAFSAMLYRVDISEKEYRMALDSKGTPKEQIVAELIIRREFKKVLTRRFFKKN